MLLIWRRGPGSLKQGGGYEWRRFAPKDAFSAWPWGRIGLLAIGSAGAVRGRSAGGRSGRCPRCRTRCHRDPRDATTFSTAHQSPSATAHAPHRSTCCACRNNSNAIAIRAGGLGRGVRHPTKRTREAHALLVREYSRNERSTVSASKSPPRFAGAGIREGPFSACPHAR